MRLFSPGCCRNTIDNRAKIRLNGMEIMSWAIDPEIKDCEIEPAKNTSV